MRTAPDGRNPLVRARRGLRLSLSEWQKLLDIDQCMASHHERGHVRKMRPTYKRALQRIGMDAEKLAREYDEWQETRHREQIERVPAGLPALALRS